MAQNDDDGDFDTPSGTPFHTPRLRGSVPTSDYSGKVNKQIDLDEQDKINMINRQQQELYIIKQEVARQLSELQLTAKAKTEAASGSADKQIYDDPESTHEPKGPRGRPFNSEEAREKSKERAKSKEKANEKA